jgi:hypothetical protein
MDSVKPQVQQLTWIHKPSVLIRLVNLFLEPELRYSTQMNQELEKYVLEAEMYSWAI